MVPTVKFKRLRPEIDSDLALPRPMTQGAAGMDLCAGVTEPVTIDSGSFHTIPTGFAIALPAGYEGQVRPRSGLAARHGITLLNSPGTIDADYRGEVKVIVINHGTEAFVIKRGMRIAQLVIAPVQAVTVVETQVLDNTERGDGGFGSTGISRS